MGRLLDRRVIAATALLGVSAVCGFLVALIVVRAGPASVAADYFVVSAAATISATIADLGRSQVLVHAASDARISQSLGREFVIQAAHGTSVRAVVAGALACSAVLALGVPASSAALGATVAGVGVLLINLQAILRGADRYVVASLSSLAGLAIFALPAVALVQLFDGGPLWGLLGGGLAAVAVGSRSLWGVVSAASPSPGDEPIGDGGTSAAFFLGSSNGLQVLARQGDIFVAQSLVSSTAVSAYALTSRLAGVLTLIGMAASQAVAHETTQLVRGNPSAAMRLRMVYRQAGVLLLLATSFIFLVAAGLVETLTAASIDSSALLLLCFGQWVFLLTGPGGQVLVASGQYRLVAASSLFAFAPAICLASMIAWIVDGPSTAIPAGFAAGWMATQNLLTAFFARRYAKVDMMRLIYGPKT